MCSLLPGHNTVPLRRTVQPTSFRLIVFAANDAIGKGLALYGATRAGQLSAERNLK
jgi:hypothetical protein